MTDQQTQDQKIEAALGPHMAEFGYTAVQRSFVPGKDGAKGPLFSLRFVDVNPDHEMTSKPMVEVFASTMGFYPNQRGEILIYQWNWVGAATSKILVKRLQARGYKARTTIRRGTVCIAVVVPGL